MRIYILLQYTLIKVFLSNIFWIDEAYLFLSFLSCEASFRPVYATQAIDTF